MSVTRLSITPITISLAAQAILNEQAANTTTDAYSAPSTDTPLPAPDGTLANARYFASAAPLLETQAAAINTVPVADPNLEAALATIDPEKIKKDLYWVAADARQGRETPSPGQTETANYIRDRLVQFGWAPAGKPGTGPDSYFYSYKLWDGGVFKLPKLPKRVEGGTSEGADDASVSNGANITGSFLTDGVNTHDFAYGKDYFYSSLKSKGDVELTGDVVLAGVGSQDQFSKVDVQGKWAVCFDDPTISATARREWAKAAGAKGLIVLPNPKIKDEYYDGRLDKLSDMAKAGTLRYAYDCNFDEIMITKTGAEHFFALLQHSTGLENAESLLTPTATLHLSFTDKRVMEKPFAAVEAQNVLGFWKGSDPELSKQVIFISAHYDHLGTDSSGRVFNGADDNGSGTCALLAMAEAIAKLNPKRSVILMWNSGEEKGLLGSQAFVSNPYFPEGVKPILDLNRDMVGRNKDDELYITPSKAHRYYNGVTRLYEKFAPTEGFTLGSADQYFNRSDQASYIKMIGPDGKPIKVAFITSGLHPDYHKTTDDPEKINYSKMARLLRLDMRVLNELQADKLDL